MRKCKCNSNYCLHNRENSVDKIDDFLSTENAITINNSNRSRSLSPEYQKVKNNNRSRSPSPEYQKVESNVRSRRNRSPKFRRSSSNSPTRKKYSKLACKHIMFKTAKALCNPKLRKKYAKVIVKKQKEKCKK